VYHLWQIAILTTLGLSFTGCKKSTSDDKNTSPVENNQNDADEFVPQLFKAISPIDLSYTKEDGLNLGRTLLFDCKEPRNSNLGIFGGLWFYACVTSQLSTQVLFGQTDPYAPIGGPKDESGDKGDNSEKTDGQPASAKLQEVDPCTKVVEGDKTSFFAILCQLQGETIIDAELDVSSKDQPLFAGVSFAAVNGLPSSGSYSPGKSPSYPLGARIWDGPSLNNLSPSYAISMESATAGTIDIFYNFGENDIAQGQLIYRQAPDNVDCATTMEKTDCHVQQFSLFGGDVNTRQKGIFSIIRANKKTNPDFISIEGSWTLTAAQADRLMTIVPGSADDTLFEEGRKLYFRMIKKDRLLWAQYIIRNEAGEIINGAGAGLGQGKILAEAAGHCMSFDKMVNEDQDQYRLFNYHPCEDVDFAKLAESFTVGEDSITFVQDPLPVAAIDFSR
jgi:hypothetical protein